MAPVFAPFLLTLSLGTMVDDQAQLQGSWKITALVEDGQSLSEKQIAESYAADGRFEVTGNTISILPPGSFERRKIVFTLPPSGTPKAIDIAGAQKANSQGIYMLDGDSLVICLGTPQAKARPTSFAADKGSNNFMIAMQRAKSNATPAAGSIPQNLPRAVPAPDLRTRLIGTWGHQDSDSIYYYTLNADGTFSTTHEWKKGFQKLFNETVRSSGTWKLDGNVVIVTVTASTDRDRQGQIYSTRVTNLGPSDLIAINQYGQVRHEWRVR